MLFLLRRRVVKEPWRTVNLHRKIVLNVLTNAHGALLAIHKFEAIARYSPIHRIKRKVPPHGVNNFIALFIIVDVLTLESRTDI